MMRKAKAIMGLALGLAAILVAIDHTRNRLPASAVAEDAKPSATNAEPPRDSDAAPPAARTKPAAPGY